MVFEERRLDVEPKTLWGGPKTVDNVLEGSREGVETRQLASFNCADDNQAY
jgi:hypothetical protein